MNRKYIGIALIVIGFILLAAFTTVGREDTTMPLTPVSQDPLSPVVEEPTAAKRVIQAVKTFEDGVHYIGGTIELPTPCHELTHKIAVAESFPEQVTILFETSTTAEVCVQVIAEVPFDLEIAVSEKATFTARLNNEPIILDFAFEGGSNTE